MRNLSLFLLIVASTACNACGDGTGGPGTGGVSGVGGVVASGGQSATGGASASGGAPGSGGAVPGSGGALPGSGGGLGSGGASATGGATGTGGGSSGGSVGELEWLPSWATTIQQTEESNLPPAPGLPGNTLRQFVWPTVSGSEIRIQLSNEKGTAPVEITKVHVANAKTSTDPANSMGQIDAATDAAFTFGGMPNVTIPAGQTVWSDGIAFPLEDGKLTAISMQFATQIPTEITGHPGARTSSYVGSGDAVASESMPGGAGVKERWYFINAIEVMAPADAFAIAALGDSITDGYGVLNVFSRWTDHLTLALNEDVMLASKVSVLNFGMGANNLTKSGNGQDSGVIRFGRDVLTRDKIKWLIVMEGVNDLNGSVTPETLMAAYEDIITQAEAAGIEVFISPLTPMNAEHKESKNTLNGLIRALPNYNPGVDFDMAIRDPGNNNNTQAAYKNDNLHPSLAGYEAMAQSIDLTLFYP